MTRTLRWYSQFFARIPRVAAAMFLSMAEPGHSIHPRMLGRKYAPSTDHERGDEHTPTTFQPAPLPSNCTFTATTKGKILVRNPSDFHVWNATTSPLRIVWKVYQIPSVESACHCKKLVVSTIWLKASQSRHKCCECVNTSYQGLVGLPTIFGVAPRRLY